LYGVDNADDTQRQTCNGAQHFCLGRQFYRMASSHD